MSIFGDFFGTLGNYFKIGLGGVRLKNSNENLLVRNNADTQDTSISAKNVAITGNSANILTLARSGAQSGNLTITFPPNYGSPNQVLQTDGVTGITTWVTPQTGSTATLIVDTTTLGFGATSPLNLFALPENAVVEKVRIIPDIAFNAASSLSIGVAGSTSKYFPSNYVDLSIANCIFEVHPGISANSAAENLIATYAANGATVGSARIEVEYCIPA